MNWYVLTLVRYSFLLDFWRKIGAQLKRLSDLASVFDRLKGDGFVYFILIVNITEASDYPGLEGGGMHEEDLNGDFTFKSATSGIT